MSDAAEKLRSRNRFAETLPSGLNVTLRLPRIRDCIVAGAIPLPVLSHVAQATQQNGDTPDVSNEDAAHMARYQDEIVRRSVVEIEGEPIEMTLELVGELLDDDYKHIVRFATREAPIPKGQT
jgi:hypothetical protein